jgi:hypothetical protein
MMVCILAATQQSPAACIAGLARDSIGGSGGCGGFVGFEFLL